jgi:hypothetical protein
MSAPSTDTRLEWESRLPGVSRLPHRMGAFLVGMNPWMWGSLFVAVPLVALAATTIIGPQAAITYVVVCACLWLVIWFSSPRFKHTRHLLEPDSRTLTIRTEFADPETEQFAAAIGTDEIEVDLEEVDSLVTVSLSSHVVCRLRYRSLNLDSPEAVVIPRDRLRDVGAAFRSCNVSFPNLTPGDEPKPRGRAVGAWLRLAATPVLIGALPLYVVQIRLGIDVWPFLFGFAVVAGVMIGRYFTIRSGIRPDGSRPRDWIARWAFDVVLAAVALVVILGASVVFGSIR